MSTRSISRRTRRLKGDLRVEVSISTTGERTIATGYSRDDSPVRTSEGPDVGKYEVNGFALEVSQRSFWQSHKLAPTVLAKALLEYAKLQPGDKVLDLYGGVGLFTSQFLEAVGESGSVDLVEGSKSATADAMRNFANFSNVSVHTGDVAKLLPRFSKVDVIVLDPPREGAGKDVVTAMVALKPRSIVYVACDPVALARDLDSLSKAGYQLRGLKSLDIFPHTHHFEAVAALTLG